MFFFFLNQAGGFDSVRQQVDTASFNIDMKIDYKLNNANEALA